MKTAMTSSCNPHLATSEGKNDVQVVEETATSMLTDHAEFIAGVERGIAASKRGDVTSHEEVVARIDRLFNS